MALLLDDQPGRATTERDAAVAIFRADELSHPLTHSLEQLGTKDGELRDYERLYRSAQQAAPDSRDAARAEYLLASAYSAAGSWDAALQHFQHVIAIHDRLEVRDRDTVRALEGAAWLLHHTGKYRDAIALATRGVQIADEIGDEPGLVGALQVQGQAYLAVGDHRSAREPLERALGLREKLHDGAGSRGFTKFLLAIATWDVDPARALDLAVAARVDLQGDASRIDPWGAPGLKLDNDNRQKLDEIARWIAAHPLKAPARRGSAAGSPR
jgi:tetratricopeptide (TPR) repeat protein